MIWGFGKRQPSEEIDGAQRAEAIKKAGEEIQRKKAFKDMAANDSYREQSGSKPVAERRPRLSPEQQAERATQLAAKTAKDQAAANAIRESLDLPLVTGETMDLESMPVGGYTMKGESDQPSGAFTYEKPDVTTKKDIKNRPMGQEPITGPGEQSVGADEKFIIERSSQRRGGEVKAGAGSEIPGLQTNMESYADLGGILAQKNAEQKARQEESAHFQRPLEKVVGTLVEEPQIPEEMPGQKSA